MSINQRYTRELRDNLNYTATWLPNVSLSLGDIGVLSRHQFTHRTNLKNLNIPFTESVLGTGATYSYASSGTVTRHMKLAGQAPLPGSALTELDAGITLTFGKQHALVFLATDCRIKSIADQDPLKKAILDAYGANQWERNYVVVTELVVARSTSVIISEGSEGQYELKAKAGLVPTFEAMNVAGSFSLVHDSQISFNFLAKSSLTPLFRCLGLRLNWFRTDVVTRGDIVTDGSDEAETASATQHITVDEVEYDDYRDEG